jgi:hypothetical protein
VASRVLTPTQNRANSAYWPCFQSALTQGTRTSRPTCLGPHTWRQRGATGTLPRRNLLLRDLTMMSSCLLPGALKAPGQHSGGMLFEQTMDRIIDGQLTGDCLTAQGIVPTVKVNQSLADEVDSVQLMKPLTKLEPLLAGALERSMFGTKMRSVIKSANPAGIQAIADQQFAAAAQILAHGLVPILEPEVNVYAPDKAEAETLFGDDVLAVPRRAAHQPAGGRHVVDPDSASPPSS